MSELRSSPIIALSPHSDDIPLSLGAAITAGNFGHPLTVIIVFSVSRYTRYRRGTAPQAATTRLRKREERAAAQVAGYDVDFLELPEPFARSGFVQIDDIFDPCRTPKSEPIWREAVSQISDSLKGCTGPVLVPLGCGGHIDHKIVRAAFTEIGRRRRDLSPIFYEDLPYASSLSLSTIAALVPRSWRGSPLHCVRLAEGNIESKQQLLRVYQSQLTDEDIDRVCAHWSRLGNAERVWMPQMSATSMGYTS